MTQIGYTRRGNFLNGAKVYKQTVDTTKFNWGAARLPNLCLQYATDVLRDKISGAMTCADYLKRSGRTVHAPEECPRNLTAVYWWAKSANPMQQHVAIVWTDETGKQIFDDNNGTHQSIEDCERKSGMNASLRTGWTAGGAVKILDAI